MLDARLARNLASAMSSCRYNMIVYHSLVEILEDVAEDAIAAGTRYHKGRVTFTLEKSSTYNQQIEYDLCNELVTLGFTYAITSNTNEAIDIDVYY